MNNNKIRVAFEDWQSDGGKWKKCIEQNSAGYALMQTSLNWRAWQAGGAAYIAEIERLNANLAQTKAAEIEYLANAEHVFSDSQDAMQCLDYLRALRDVDVRRQEVPKRCPACGGNDAGMPCAYPSEGKAGCPRDARLRATNRTDFKTWERATLEQFARQVADEHLAFTKRITATAWRPVSTLPETYKLVMLFDILAEEKIYPGRFNGIQWLYNHSGNDDPAIPSHWAPMPAGPQLASAAPIPGRVIEIPESAVMFANPGHDYDNNADLDCPHCGGSGHKDDVTATPQLKVDVVMTMVQEFASTWSLVGHQSFDNGSMLEQAEALKENIRNMLEKENCNG